MPVNDCERADLFKKIMLDMENVQYTARRAKQIVG